MKRLYLWVLIAVALLIAALGAARLRPADPPKIGFLGLDSTMQAPRVAAFEDELRKLGYASDKTVVIESRYAEGKFDRLDALAAELVASKVKVIVTASPQGVRAAKKATRTIPIVMSVHDPIGLGFAESLRRPGGNITGIAFQDSDLSAKRIDLLRQTVPGLERVAVLWDPAATSRETVIEIQRLAESQGIRSLLLEVHGPAEFGPAVAEARRWGAQALVQMAAPMMTLNRRALVDVLSANRIPASCEMRWYVDDGCLMAYGADLNGLFRAMAPYVAKILEGADPATMAIDQPREFELVVNLRTAAALGLNLPPTLRTQVTDFVR